MPEYIDRDAFIEDLLKQQKELMEYTRKRHFDELPTLLILQGISDAIDEARKMPAYDICACRKEDTCG